MHALITAVGRTFAKTFAAAFVVYALGVAWAPNLSDRHAYALGVAAILALIAAAVAVVQTYQPRLTFAHWLSAPYGGWADAFGHGFLGGLVVSLTGVAGAPDLHTIRALLVAAVVGAFNAGVRALEDALTKGEPPLRAGGVPDPPPTGR